MVVTRLVLRLLSIRSFSGHVAQLLLPDGEVFGVETPFTKELSKVFIRHSGGIDHQIELRFGGESARGRIVKSTAQSTGFALLDSVANGLVMDTGFTAHFGHASAIRGQDLLQNAVPYGV